MKILWFSLTPALATEKLTGQLGIGNGWISSMQQLMLDQPGVELAVVFPGKSDQLETFKIDNTTYYAYPTARQGKFKRILTNHLNTTDDSENLQHYLSCIEDFRPDVIHIFGTERNFGLIIPHIEIPAMIWIQGNLTVITKMWFNKIRKWDVWKYSPVKKLLKGESHWHKYRRGLKTAKLEQQILNHSRYILGRTSWDRRVMSLLAPQASYFHCDEVLRPVFYETRWSPPADNRKFILMSTIQDNLFKGFDVIFGCAALLLNILGDKFEWRIAGIGPQHDLLRIVEKKFRTKASSLRITPLGRIPAPQLISELLNANVFVHPSYIDNSPNSVCEAMIIGMPVISSNTGGVPDLLENLKEGLLVQPGDIWAFAGAILDIYNDPQQAAEFGKSARHRALKRHDPEKIISDLIRISEHVCQMESNPVSHGEY